MDPARLPRAPTRETGSSWNLSGEATDGPLLGHTLEALPSRTSFWFAYVAAFPEVDVHAP